MKKQAVQVKTGNHGTKANAMPGPKSSEQTFQFKDNRAETASLMQLQKISSGHSLSKSAPPVQRMENKTGLPDNLKSGVESLSGISMDDVKVHYNSSQPAQLNAHAYAQGTDIHVAPGQEKHLAHEAWHVVQQKQGRVQPTMQLKGKVNVNDDKGLEKEADMMGAKAMQMKSYSAVNASKSVTGNTVQRLQAQMTVPNIANHSTGIVQRQIQLADVDDGQYEETETGKTLPQDTELYYCGIFSGGKPVFVLKSLIDEIDSDIESSENDSSQVIAYIVMSKLRKARFYTDDGDVTDKVLFAQLALNNALSHPLLKDPNRARGLQHRFADADGVLFSRLNKEKVEEELGTLPDTVQFYQIPEEEWNAEVLKHKSFWTEITANYAYGRHMNKRGITPRNLRSKFKTGALSTTDHNAFSDETYTASLPPAQAAEQTTGWVDYKRYVNKVPRGKGQFSAMRKWNALAYAAYWFHHGQNELNIDQDWEWLHIQGSQNGGATNITNLVAGTSTTNSRMIPWEDNINSWTLKAKPDHPLSVKYTGKRVPNTNLGKKIEIDVAAEKGIPDLVGPVTKSAPMSLIFHPLDGTVYDKISNKITDKTLAKEALNDSTVTEVQKRKMAKTKKYIDSKSEGRANLTITSKDSEFKGHAATFIRYNGLDSAVMSLHANQKIVIVPLWGLHPFAL